MRLVLSRRGMVVWRVRVLGRAAHSGLALWAGRSAALAAARLVVAVELANEREAELAEAAGGGAAVTFNAGRVEGGSTHNTVAAEAEVVVEMRAEAGAPFRRGMAVLAGAALAADAGCGPSLPCDAEALRRGAELAAALPAVLQAAAFGERQGEGLRVSVEERVRALPWPRTAEGDSVAAAIGAAAAELGVECGVQARGGLSDANNLWVLAPTVDALGPHGEGAHCAAQGGGAGPAERVLWPSVLPKAVLLAEAISRLP